MTTTVDARRETVSLIGSDKVETTAVYGADDQKIGSVQRVMIDKISGKVAYAVVSFGGFLGNGRGLFPNAVGKSEIRHQSRRLSDGNDREPTEGRSEVQPKQRLGLV